MRRRHGASADRSALAWPRREEGSVRATRRIRVAALLGAACLAASASACGGGGGKTIPKTDYLAQAKVVCQKGNRALTAASNDVIAKLAPGQKLPEPEIEDFVRKTV